MALIWGVPYFLIRVAVKQLDPPVVVFGRTSLAAAILLVLARRSGAIRPALRKWKPVLIFAIIEMAIPWILLTTAEEHLASGLTALIIASVPIVGTIAAFVLGDRNALRFVRIVGITLGLGGVALLVGKDLSSDQAPPWWSVAMVLDRGGLLRHGAVPGRSPARRRTVARGHRGVAQHRDRDLRADRRHRRCRTRRRASTVLAVLGLSLICTGLAFIVFFRLIDEVGPARAGLITFANPVVAVALGTVFLDEALTIATGIGFMLVIAGCWLATRPPPVSVDHAADAPLLDAAAGGLEHRSA